MEIRAAIFSCTLITIMAGPVLAQPSPSPVGTPRPKSDQIKVTPLNSESPVQVQATNNNSNPVELPSTQSESPSVQSHNTHIPSEQVLAILLSALSEGYEWNLSHLHELSDFGWVTVGVPTQILQNKIEYALTYMGLYDYQLYDYSSGIFHVQLKLDPRTINGLIKKLLKVLDADTGLFRSQAAKL